MLHLPKTLLYYQWIYHAEARSVRHLQKGWNKKFSEFWYVQHFALHFIHKSKV